IGPALANTWQHIVVVSDGATAISTYLDGAAGGSATWESATVPLQFEVLKFGLNRTPTTWPYQGLVDDVRVYTSALTASQIQSLHDGPCAAPPPAVNCVGSLAAPVLGETA